MRSTSQKFGGFREDILGAGLHILSGAGGDLRLALQQMMGRMMADQYVTREEYEGLLTRLEALEGKKPIKAATKPAARKAAKAKKPARK